ncbi:uncharacterized protein LOC143373959 isoform X2 [Andrena cerasifolii]|uniref:uncharacterized protein LOC143373959 isoform X2 n=1 Tax=Andrena cerasifolii TaxID=2819439 RepID=UPI00403826B8
MMEEYAIGKSLAPTTTLCKRFEGELSMSFVPEAWNCGKNSLSEIGGLRDNASALELILPATVRRFARSAGLTLELTSRHCLINAVREQDVPSKRGIKSAAIFNGI